MTHTHLDEAPGREEEDEHADRIEVHLAAGAQRIEHTRQPGQQQGERHRHIHAEPASPKIAPRARQERRAAVEQYRCHDDHAGDAHQLRHRGVDVGHAIQRAEIHHRLHHAERRESDPLERHTSFALVFGRGGGTREWHRPESGTRDRAEDLRQAGRTMTSPRHRDSCGRIVDAHRGHVRQGSYRLLDAARAGSAVHAVDQEHDMFVFARVERPACMQCVDRAHQLGSVRTARAQFQEIEAAGHLHTNGPLARGIFERHAPAACRQRRTGTAVFSGHDARQAHYPVEPRVGVVGEQHVQRLRIVRRISQRRRALAGGGVGGECHLDAVRRGRSSQREIAVEMFAFPVIGRGQLAIRLGDGNRESRETADHGGAQQRPDQPEHRVGAQRVVGRWRAHVTSPAPGNARRWWRALSRQSTERTVSVMVSGPSGS